MRIEDAKAYTGIPEYWGISGNGQLEILKKEGLLPTHNVLEIGCGSLNASIPIINYLEKDRYVGIEPHWILIEVMKHLIDESKNPTFVSNQHFDVWSVDKAYDYIIGHSVFSHAPEWQLIQCLHNLISVLKTGSKIYFSLHFGEGSEDVFWKDKGNTFYSFEMIKYYADRLGYEVKERKDIKTFFMKYVPPDYHDWVQFIKL